MDLIEEAAAEAVGGGDPEVHPPAPPEPEPDEGGGGVDYLEEGVPPDLEGDPFGDVYGFDDDAPLEALALMPEPEPPGEPASGSGARAPYVPGPGGPREDEGGDVLSIPYWIPGAPNSKIV